MKIRTTVVSVMVAGSVLAISPAVSMAQSSGQFAVAQPKAPYLPTQGPAIATRAPLKNLPAGSRPIVIIQPPAVNSNPFTAGGQFFPPSQTVVSNPVFDPSMAFRPNQVFAPTQVFIPNQVFGPTQSVIPDQFVLPMQPQMIMPPTQLLVPGQTVIPDTTSQTVTSPEQSFTGPSQAYFGLPSVVQRKLPLPAQGTARAELIQKFGNPIMTVGTSSGETLYFKDGTKVTLQNGQVTGSK